MKVLERVPTRRKKPSTSSSRTICWPDAANGKVPIARSENESRECDIALESVREHHLELHSFRVMRRMEASLRKASALRLRHSQSLASLRHRPSQAKVRSTIHRFGKTTKRWA